MEDWLPKLSTINDPIADDTWAYKTQSGAARTSRITIGRPEPLPGDPNGDWYCPVYFEHVTPEILCAIGVGPVDALINAMRFVRNRFDEFTEVQPRASPLGKNPPPE